MSFFNNFIKNVIDFILPPLCPVCKNRTDAPHAMCHVCFNKIRFVSKPYCQKCGRPFEFQIPEETRCAACCKKDPIYHKARTCFIYDSFSKKLSLPFKHGDHLELSPLLTNLLYQGGNDLFDEIDVLMAVPLHKLRFIKRKYNQAGVLAMGLSKKINKPYLSHVLLRSRHTKSQGHMHAEQRKRNVTGAFTVKNKHLIDNKRILLIDDVMTTGSTLNECTRVLLKNGAKSVSILTLSRVLKF